MPVVHQAVGGDDIRAALRTILASESFSRSQQLSRLLKYLCTCLIENGADRIAEYTIGTEVLGRPSNFDPTQDAAVRVEMHRLRRRLRDYYEGEGASDPIRIVIPPGRYAPVVTWAGEEPREQPAAAGPLPDRAIAPVEAVENGLIDVPVRARTRVPRGRWVLLALGVSATLLLLTFLAWRRQVGSVPGLAHAEIGKSTASLPLPAPLLGFRIGCGRSSAWTDRLGQVWGRDEYFQGGSAIEIPARSYVPGAFDARLFESARSGDFSYRIPLPSRTYELHLYFVEPTFGPDTDAGGEGNRLFSVTVNGQRLLDRFDILADAGGSWTADVRVFKDISPGSDGYVHIDFQGLKAPGSNGAPIINAIEFVPARPHILNPVRILPQDNFYTDSAGNLWTPDKYSRGGRMSLHPGPLHNTRDQEIFRHERFGHFKYDIPVDHGSYSLYLYMAEEYWGPGNPGGGGVGTRVFDVFCNGVALVRNLDLIKDFGPNYGVVRAFHHLTPNSQGKLTISFEPDHDYASLYALEVIDEAGADTSSAAQIMTANGPGI